MSSGSLPGITLRARSGYGRPARCTWRSGTRRPLAKAASRDARSGQDGNFRVAGCPPGKQPVTASAEGFCPRSALADIGPSLTPVALKLEAPGRHCAFGWWIATGSADHGCPGEPAVVRSLSPAGGDAFPPGRAFRGTPIRTGASFGSTPLDQGPGVRLFTPRLSAVRQRLDPPGWSGAHHQLSRRRWTSAAPCATRRRGKWSPGFKLGSGARSHEGQMGPSKPFGAVSHWSDPGLQGG